MNKFFQGYKYLGRANGWQGTPADLKKHNISNFRLLDQL